MQDLERDRPATGPRRGLHVELTEVEQALLTEYAEGQGLDLESAAAALLGDGLAALMHRVSGYRPSSSVVDMQRARSERRSGDA